MNDFWLLLKENYEGLIALFALALAIYEGRATRKHNRLSMRPTLEMGFAMDAGDNITGKDPVSIAYELKNTGLGPAKITDVKITFAGRDFRNEGIGAFLQENIFKIEEKYKEPLGGDVHTFFLGPDITIKPNEQINLINITARVYSKNTVRDLVFLLRDIGFIISYKSLYEETFTCKRPAVKCLTTSTTSKNA